MWIGIILTLILSYFLIFEVIIVYYTNPKFMNQKRREEEVKIESRLYGTRALTLAGLIFAGVIFLIDNYNETYNDTLLIMVFSFGLLLVSYNFEVLTGDKELYLIVQDRLLTYGFMGLMMALSVFFWNLSKRIFYITFIFIILFGLLHLVEIKILLETVKVKKDKEKDE